MTRHLIPCIAAFVSLLVVASGVVAQPTVDLRGDEVIDREPIPGLLPEGSFLVRQFGTMRRVGAAGWVFIFAPDAGGETLPPMPLLPSANLQAMEQIAAPAEEAGREAGFLVSGQVFRYDGGNYLLPTIFVQADGPDATPAEAPVESAEEAPERPDPFAGDEDPEPSVDEILARIEEASQQAPTGEPSAQFAPNPAGLVPEGTLVASRRGRVLRSDSGGWRFTPDVDADAPTGQDQPMDLLPCALLESMLEERRLLGSQPYIVSGRVFIYNGRNYLLPTMFVIERSGAAGLSTAQ